MTRRTKLIINTLTGVLKQTVTLICGFVLPRYMLLYYGSSVNGLVSSMTHFLSFISLLDMGVGSVIMANLYQPLAKKDNAQLSRIVKSSELFFRRLATIFLAYIVVLCIGYPTVINVQFEAIFSITLLLIVAISTFAQYFFGMTYEILLYADQKSYVPMLMQIGTVVFNTVFSIILMRIGASIHVVKLMTSSVFILRPLGQMIYVRKHYRIDKKIDLVGEPIQQKWNGFSQHLASVICQNIDVVVLTAFSSLSNVSIYTVYYSVTYGIEQIILTAATGIESLFGNMIAKQEIDRLINTFSVIELIIHTIVTCVFSITAIMIIPFVKVYTRGITDANYVVPLFAAILVSAYAVQCLRVPYFRVIKAAGHFKQTQNGSYIAAALNTVITVLLVFKYGLIGAASGTLVAMLYHTCYFVLYLRKNILNRPLMHFAKHVLVDCIIAGCSCGLASIIEIHADGYLQWAIYAVGVAFIVLIVSLSINFIFYRSEIRKVFLQIKEGKNKFK